MACLWRNLEATHSVNDIILVRRQQHRDKASENTDHIGHTHLKQSALKRLRHAKIDRPKNIKKFCNFTNEWTKIHWYPKCNLKETANPTTKQTENISCCTDMNCKIHWTGCTVLMQKAIEQVHCNYPVQHNCRTASKLQQWLQEMQKPLDVPCRVNHL